jgi:hypothetical protein
MSNKEVLINNIKSWIGLDNEIKILQKEIKNRREQKKLLTTELVGVMKTNDIDCWNTGEGKLIYSKTKSKAPLSKKHLLNSLLKFFQNDETMAKELSKFIMESREIKENENIRRKIPKNK